MRRFRNIAWIILLAAACVPVGYLFQYVFNDRFIRSEFVGNLIISGIAMWFVFGAIALIIWGFLKSRQTSDPAKPALITVTVFVFLFGLLAGAMYPAAAKRMNIKEFMYAHKEEVNQYITERIGIEAGENPDWAAIENEMVMCASVKWNDNELFVQELMASRDLHETCLNSPLLGQELEYCYELYK